MTSSTTASRNFLIIAAVAATVTSAAALLGLSGPAGAAGLEIGGDIGIGATATGGDGGAGAEADGGFGMTLGARGEADGATGGAVAGAAGGNANVALAGTTTATDAFAGIGNDARIDMVINLIANSQWQGNEFGGNVSVDGAAAYDVAAWLTDETEARFRSAVESAWREIVALQTAIAANPTMSAWLLSQNIDLSTVVAVGVNAEGQLVAFTQ